MKKFVDKVLFSVQFDRSLLTSIPLLLLLLLSLLNNVIVVVFTSNIMIIFIIIIFIVITIMSSFSLIMFVIFCALFVLLSFSSLFLSMIQAKNNHHYHRQKQRQKRISEIDPSIIDNKHNIINDLDCVISDCVLSKYFSRIFISIKSTMIMNHICVVLYHIFKYSRINSRLFIFLSIIIPLINNLPSSKVFAQFINNNNNYNNHLRHQHQHADDYSSASFSSSSSAAAALNFDHFNDDQINDSNENDDDQTVYPKIRALLGKNVGLPCNISQSETNSIKLILWFRNDSGGTPIYTVDARDTQNLSLAKHFLDISYRKRASFEINPTTRTALLIINPIVYNDDGHYICRVDYRWTRTKISNIRLEVIVPPLMIQIVQSYQYQPEIIQSKMGVNHPHGIYHPLLTTNINNNNNTFDMNRKSFEKNFYHLVQSNIKSMTNYNINNINQNKLNESLIRQYNSDINLDNQMQTSTLVMNENVIIVKQPESSILTLSCDSIGGKPMSMIKWYRLMSFENVNLTDAQLYTLLQSSEKSMQLIDDSYYPMVLPLSSNIPRLLLNAINNQTFRNSFDTMMNTNDDNDNDNNSTIAFDSKLDEIKTTIENKSKNNRMNPTTIEELFYENKNIYNNNNNNNNNGSDVMRKISIVRNDLNIGKISIDNHGQLYLCRTTNTNLTRSIDIIIRLEVFAGPKSVQIKQLLHEQDKQFHHDVYFNANSDNKNNLIMTEMSSNNRTWHSIELLDHYLQHHGSLNDAVKIVQSSSTTVDEQSEILKASKIDISNNLNNNNQWTHAKKSFRIRSGYEFEFTCQANGSLPNAKIFWYLQDMNTNHLRNITDSSNIYQNGRSAISYLRIVPQYTDNNAKLICQAYNQEMLYELIMSLRKQKWTNDTYPFGQIVSSGTFSLSSSSSSSSLQPENNDINENLVNFLLTDIILNNDKLQQQQQQQHQQQYFHHHYHHHHQILQQQQQQKQQESVIAKNILEQFYYYYLKHYPYQLHTTVYLDVNYKPIIVIKVLSGEQMYKEVSSSSSSSTFNSNQINNDNNNINDDDQDQQQRTTIKSTIIEQQQQHSSHHNHNHHYYRFKEMSEIFFNCSINSNPDAHLIEWFMNEKLIHTEITKGIIITNNNRTLIISPLQRRSSGIYYCVAANILGKTVSDRVQIDILFKPQCQVEFVQTYYQHLDDYVQLKCHIIANPNENVQFTWRFNDSIFIGDINGAYSSSSSSETFIDHLSVIQDSRSSSSSIEDVFVVDQALINQKNRQNIRQMLPRTKSSSIHTNIDNKYLITNIIKIRLKKWSSFGHFTCTAKNEIGLQNEPCRWQLIPHHHHQHYRNNYQSHQNNNNNQHHHLYHKHHFHHQDQENSQSLITSSSPSLSRLPNQLNNCHIIESSNAVVIKCSNGVEIYEHDVDNTRNSNMELMMLNGNNSENYFSSEFSDDDSALSAFKVRPLLTYHVQVFRLSSNINGNNNYNNDSNMKSLQNFLNNENENTPNENDETNDEKKSSEQKYFQQKSIPDLNISNQPESKKQIASIHGSSLSTQTSTFKPLISSEKKSSSSSSSTNDPVLIMDTLNFTNPLFIITNLTSSTSYLLRIWSSKQHMYDSMIEQVNITVRTKPDDNEFDNGYSNNIDGDRSRIKQRKSMKIFHNLLTMLSFNGDDISSLFLFIFIIFIISLFLIIIVIYFVRKITHIYRNHKDKKRGLNTKRKNNDNNETNNLENSNNLYENEKQSTATINVLETALCEMRPETLENDLKYKNSSTTPACSTATLTAITSPYSAILDTFKPYNINNNENDHQKYRQQHFQLNENLSSASSSKTTATTATASSSSSSALIIKCDLPESSIITYQNYLFPMTSNESSTVNVTATTATATSSTATLIATNEGHIANLMANTGANTNNNNNNNGACISIDSTNVFNEINVLDSVITAASNNSHSHMANYTPTEFAMNMNDSITATSSMLHHQSHQHHQQQNYNHLQDLIHNHYQHQYDHCNNSISNTNNNHHHHQQQQQQQQCFDHSNVINDDNDNNNNNNDGSNIMNSSGVGHIGFDDNNNNNNNKNSGESFLLSSNSFQYPLSVRIVPTNINDTAAATATAAVAISQQFDTGSSSTPTTTTDIISMSYNNNNDHNNNNNISNSNENVCTNNKNNSINKIHTLV